MSTLEVATSGCCKGHPCDNCKTCQSGRCCRRDNPSYQLPKLGEWSGPIYGKLGVLEDDGTKVECHCCGEWFKAVGHHAWHAHNLTSMEYKSIFGLRHKGGIMSVSTKKIWQGYAARLARVRPEVSAFTLLTPEQRDAYCKLGGRGNYSLQTKLDTTLRPTGPKAEMVVHVCPICGATEEMPKHKARIQTCSNPQCKQQIKLRTHCSKGHALTEDNLIITKDGIRRCKACRTASNEAFHKKQKAG